MLVLAGASRDYCRHSTVKRALALVVSFARNFIEQQAVIARGA